MLAVLRMVVKYHALELRYDFFTSSCFFSPSVSTCGPSLLSISIVKKPAGILNGFAETGRKRQNRAAGWKNNYCEYYMPPRFRAIMKVLAADKKSVYN